MIDVIRDLIPRGLHRGRGRETQRERGGGVAVAVKSKNWTKKGTNIIQIGN